MLMIHPEQFSFEDRKECRSLYQKSRELTDPALWQ
jgi:hypothetical protein